MEANYLQNVRYKLQKRIRRLKAADSNQFLHILKQFWVFFDSYPILRGITEQLCAALPESADWANQTFQGHPMIGSTEEESAAIGYWVLRTFASQDDSAAFFNLVPFRTGLGETLEKFKDQYLEPLYDYVDEHLDDRNYVLFALIRYKRLCEWFERNRLYQLWNDDTQRGEKRLVADLYKYFFEQGIEFQIEPWSASGEADMVAIQKSDHPLIADAKIFNPERGKAKAYLIQGFHQLYKYTCDYNQTVGYLVIFNTSEKQPRFVLQNAAEPVPRVLINNKAIFFVEVDIYPHAEPASQRKPPEVVEIKEEDILAALTPASSAEAVVGGADIAS